MRNYGHRRRRKANRGRLAKKIRDNKMRLSRPTGKGGSLAAPSVARRPRSAEMDKKSGRS